MRLAHSPGYAKTAKHGVGAVLTRHVAFVTEEHRGAGSNHRADTQTDDQTVSLRLTSVDREGQGWSACKGRCDRPDDVGIFVAPAQSELKGDFFAQAGVDAAAELRAQNAAKGTGGLLCHAEVERVGTAFDEGVLHGYRALQPR